MSLDRHGCALQLDWCIHWDKWGTLLVKYKVFNSSSKNLRFVIHARDPEGPFHKLWHVFWRTFYNIFTRKRNFITSVVSSVYMPVTHSWSSRCPSFSHSLILFTISFSFLPLPPPPPSVTHSDSLCNMPSSKLNSTLLDLQPFLSSKWLSSVITLQPEWETQRRGREEGWQTETWHERRGNAGLIIHTYCSKKRVSEGKRDTGRKREREK